MAAEVETPQVITEPDPKRRRGRPPKNPQAPGESAVNPVAGVEAPKRKSKRAGGGNLVAQLVGIHKLAAMVTGAAEIEISEPEAEILAEGMRGVMEEYKIEISGKTGATISLIAAAAAVYIPRVAMVIERKKVEKAEPEKKESSPELPAPGAAQKVPLVELASASAGA